MTRPFWWTADVERETNPEDEHEEPELADEQADRIEHDMTKEW
jgi:hypothetical protein